MTGQRALKSRHGLLTAVLVIMLIANAGVAISYLMHPGAIRAAIPSAPFWSVYVLAALSVFNLVCVIALWFWKRWGFWGFCRSAVVAFVANLSFGLGPAQSLLGLAGIVILFGVLQIGRESKGWPQLE